MGFIQHLWYWIEVHTGTVNEECPVLRILEWIWLRHRRNRPNRWYLDGNPKDLTATLRAVHALAIMRSWAHHIRSAVNTTLTYRVMVLLSPLFTKHSIGINNALRVDCIYINESRRYRINRKNQVRKRRTPVPSMPRRSLVRPRRPWKYRRWRHHGVPQRDRHVGNHVMGLICGSILGTFVGQRLAENGNCKRVSPRRQTNPPLSHPLSSSPSMG